MPISANRGPTRSATARSMADLPQQRIESARADRCAQPELDLPVQVVQRILGRARRPFGIGEPVARRQVDAQAHLVAGEDLLALDLQRLHAQVDHLDAQRRAVGPVDDIARSPLPISVVAY